MDLALADRVALVTAGSRGIGRAAAEALAAEGARVALTYRDCRNEAEATADAICSRGGHARAVFLDPARLDSIGPAIAEVSAAWRHVDILVNATAPDGEPSMRAAIPFEETPPAKWVPSIRATVEGTYAVIQSVLPGMREARWGRIVSVSSTAAVDGLPGCGWCATATSALHGLTRTLARELGPLGILVNVVMPEPVQADHDSMQATASPGPEQRTRPPLQRPPSLEDVAATIAFLASGANTIVTGEIIRVCG